MDLNKAAGIIVLGSGASVNDDLIWQTELRGWLRAAMAVGIPMLGLCYGHQLMANMAGSTVGFAQASGEKYKGLRSVRLERSRLWGDERSLPLVVSHCEMVQRCPADWRVIGSSSQVPIEALEHQSLPFWSFQSHPEATPQFIQHQGLPSPVSADVLQGGWALVDAFLGVVADQVSQ